MNHTCTRYFLNPDGSLCAVPSPGRCGRYWELWGRRSVLDHQLADRPQEPHLSALKEQHVDAELHLSAHLEVCEACQAWLDECRLIRFQTPVPDPALA